MNENEIDEIRNRIIRLEQQVHWGDKDKKGSEFNAVSLLKSQISFLWEQDSFREFALHQKRNVTESF